jgi:hypothetical protein
MTNWDEVQKTIRGFLKEEVLGSGFINEYYDEFAYSLTQYLKALAAQDAPETTSTSTLRVQLHEATQTVTITKIGDSSVYVGMTRDDAANLYAQLARELGLK